jgi:hypothetical protein
MKKTYCDVCGKEMTDVTSGVNLSFATSKVTGNITTTVVGEDLCKYCVLAAVSTLDDRPVITRNVVE